MAPPNRIPSDKIIGEGDLVFIDILVTAEGGRALTRAAFDERLLL